MKWKVQVSLDFINSFKYYINLIPEIAENCDLQCDVLSAQSVLCMTLLFLKGTWYQEDRKTCT